MERRRIGSLEVSAVGLGCNNFGSRLDEAGTRRVVDAALDAGIDFFDTANSYGGGGTSEEFLGRALEGRRQRAVIATKFGSSSGGMTGGGSPENVRSNAEASLRRLGIERIDLYQLHRPDPDVPIAETLGALKELVDEGKVREIGCSNFSVEQLREAERGAEDVGVRFVSVQNHFSLLEREPEEGVLDACARSDVAFIPYFPLESGLLTGKYRKGKPLPEGTRITSGWASDRLTDEALDAVERLAAFAEARGHTILDLAFAWLLAHEPVASVIAGATKPEQVRSNVAAAGWTLDAEDLAEIDEELKATSA